MADGMLVPSQLDIFTRGRGLLNDVNGLLASYREHGQRREVVFVAHGTGGIIVKEVNEHNPWPRLLPDSLELTFVPDAPSRLLIRRHSQ